MNRIADLVPDPNMLMFINKAVKNDRTTSHSRGWSLREQCCMQRRVFVHGKCYLPAITLDGIVVHNVIEGSVSVI
ncbi:hypothetical protein B0H16DRAFT_1331557 [Mycena metata]|uniref:Uncharacterized protein n=1 Tax=Mycena metata TaxID=1033252 RepID=A0AAD7MPT4_9AGAR|nr:hypothetical protein B0H16DRAFT_1331557 [Mycena metata]